MSRTRYRIYDDRYPHFMTCTVVGWLPVFTRPEAVDIVLDAWRFAQRERSLQLFAYVILENHLHFIAAAPSLSSVIKNFKSYTARKIIDLLERRSAGVLLKQLHFHKEANKVDSEYQLWQEGSQPKQIDSDEMMWQKIEYTHDNPVKRGYVSDPVHWRYSSAANYARQKGLIDVVTDWQSSPASRLLVPLPRSQAPLGNARLEAPLRGADHRPIAVREAELPDLRSQAELGNEDCRNEGGT
jgi:REP element-mobilizing transposase RayT